MWLHAVGSCYVASDRPQTTGCVNMLHIITIILLFSHSSGPVRSAKRWTRFASAPLPVHPDMPARMAHCMSKTIAFMKMCTTFPLSMHVHCEWGLHVSNSRAFDAVTYVEQGYYLSNLMQPLTNKVA